jgi:hypothetical protein
MADFTIVVTGPGGRRAEAEADTPENALLAARQVWDEVYDSTVSGRLARKAMTVTFSYDGEFVRSVSGQRP